MDGRGRHLDNIFIEFLWRSLKYGAAYLRELAGGRDAGNASRFGESTPCARFPLRFDPSDDTPNPEAWKSAVAGTGLPAMADRLLTDRPRGDSGTRLTSIQPAGNHRVSRAQHQSEYTLFSPSNCPTNQDYLR